MQLSEVAIRPGSTPMSFSRAIALAAFWACSELSTMCPVIAAWKAMSAVSSSRISPTRITSGSERRIVRRPEANVRPARGLTSIWSAFVTWYSTGSSIVVITRSSSSSWVSAAWSVLDLPLPVGPTTITAPNG